MKTKTAVLITIAFVAFMMILFPNWQKEYGQYRTNVVMNRITEHFCEGPATSEEVGGLPSGIWSSSVLIHKNEGGRTEILVQSKEAEYPDVKFYSLNIYDKEVDWGYEIIWHGENPANFSKYVRQARWDALQHINNVAREFPWNIWPLF